jgi:hypothetical protein
MRRFAFDHPVALATILGTFLILFAAEPVYTAIVLSAVAFPLYVILRTSRRAHARHEAARRKEEIGPSAEPPAEPAWQPDGWHYPDGSIVSDDVHLARQVAPGIVVAPEFRHPAWGEALERRRIAFESCLESFQRARDAIDQASWEREAFSRHTVLPAGSIRRLGSEIARLNAEIEALPAAVVEVGRAMRRRRSRRVVVDGHHIATATDGRVVYTGVGHLVPDGEVIDLDREFAAATDCRAGHFAEHAIVDRRGGRVVRECVYCFPATRWTERA